MENVQLNSLNKASNKCHDINFGLFGGILEMTLRKRSGDFFFSNHQMLPSPSLPSPPSLILSLYH